MIKVLKIILISTLVFLFVFLLFPTVYADEGGIEIEIWNNEFAQFEPLGGDAIFEATNFLPGETIKKRLKVYNLTPQNQTIGLKIVNFDGGCILDSCLAGEFMLTVGDSLYYGSLKDIFETGEVPLSEVGTGENIEYDLSVYFKEGSTEEFQGRIMSFDLQIGFFTRETVSREPSGGGAVYIPPIVGVVHITSVGSPIALTTTSVLISSETDVEAYCRVIYDTVSHPVLGNPSNYGYNFSTNPTLTNALSHNLIIGDLEIGETYFYRFVCWASPAQVSHEYSFTNLPEEIESLAKGNNFIAQVNLLDDFPHVKDISPIDNSLIKLEEDIMSESKTEERMHLFLATTGGFFSNYIIIIFLIILVILIILLFIFRYKKKKLDKKINHQ